jgi:hypothetical protein
MAVEIKKIFFRNFLNKIPERFFIVQVFLPELCPGTAIVFQIVEFNVVIPALGFRWWMAVHEQKALYGPVHRLDFVLDENVSAGLALDFAFPETLAFQLA